eukprot:597361-Hanusia_phi.AAC.4
MGELITDVAETVSRSLSEGRGLELAHGLQLSVPIVVLKVPGGHAVHAVPLSSKPALHEQLLTEVLASREETSLPAHAVQKVDPTNSLYVPSGQTRHGALPARLLNKPAGQGKQV